VRFCLDQEEPTDKVGVIFVGDKTAEVVEASHLYMAERKVPETI
jgi:hypothetical protein